MFGSSPYAASPFAAPTGGGTTVATVGLAGIASSESWGAASGGVAAGLVPAPMPTGEALGSPAIIASAAAVVAIAGVGSSERAGSPAVGTVVTVAIAPGSIRSGESWATYAIATGATPETLEAAVKAWLLASHPGLVANVGGINSIIAGRRPARGTTTYVRFETPSSVPGLFTSDSVVHHTRLVMTVYAPDRESARSLGDQVDAAFVGSRWDYQSSRGPVHTAPLTPANRSQAEEPMLGRDGAAFFYDRLEYLCREQKAR